MSAGGRPLALVTGATSGIGRSVTADLARDHDLVLLARTEADLVSLAGELAAGPGTSGAAVRTVAVDLTDDAALAAAVADLALDGLDVLVHSAGIEATGTLEELSAARWREVLDLDLVAVATLTTLLLPALRARRGLVVMINSGAGLHASPGQALYCAAKAGLRALADCLREDERGRVRVTTVYPGRVDTPMQERIQAGRGAAYRSEDHVAPSSIAAGVRLAVDTPLDAVVEDVSIRPAGML